MADQLYLSYWLRAFNQMNMLRQYEKLLRLFPFSGLSKQACVFRILAVDYGQPAIFERAYPTPPELSDVLAAAADFQSDASWLQPAMPSKAVNAIARQHNVIVCLIP